MKRYMPLSRIVRLFICLFALMLVGMLSIFNYNYYQRSTQDARQFAEKSLDETARLLENRIGGIVTTLQSIAQEGGGSAFCVRGHAWRNTYQNYIRTQLNQLALDSSIVQTAMLYTLDGVYCTAANTALENPYLLFDRLDEELQLSKPFRKPLYSQPVKSGSKILFTVVVPIWDQSGTRSLLDGYCGVMVAQINILNLLEQVNVTTQPLKLVFDGGLTIDMADMTLSSQADAGISLQMLSSTVSDYGWTLYHPDVTYTQSSNVRQMVQFTLLAGVLMLGLHIAFVYLFRHMVVLPIEQLAGTVRSSTTHNLPIAEDISSRNELVLLTRSINEMLERIRRSNEEQAQRLRERAMFMQARINPHFLYNNLECIRGMAAMQQYSAIRELTSVMADIYRYCNHSEPCVSLREELECAKKYIRLLSLRYPERLTLVVDADESTMNCRLPRMCLQPLLENSVYHGILATNRPHGTLTIQTRMEENRLCVILSDDGCGMTAEQYDQANGAALTDDYAVKHIGIGNVRNRLTLLCGEDSLLRLQSGKYGGVDVNITIRANM